jgi:hypothetical protein
MKQPKRTKPGRLTPGVTRTKQHKLSPNQRSPKDAIPRGFDDCMQNDRERLVEKVLIGWREMSRGGAESPKSI